MIGPPIRLARKPHIGRYPLAGGCTSTTCSTPSIFWVITCGGFSVILRNQAKTRPMPTMPTGSAQPGTFAVSGVQSWPETSGSAWS